MSDQCSGFEKLWVEYLNGSKERESEQLKVCLRKAETFEQARRVFGAVSSGELFALDEIRLQALGKLISLASNVEEAGHALLFASRRRRGLRLRYPQKFEEAKLKLASFEQPA